MNRIDIINRLIAVFKYSTYLEIGVRHGRCFKSIAAPTKIGVDPLGKAGAIPLTSDQFFAINQDRFDIVFIDGLHIRAQVYRDIMNALNVLSENGTIVCHDLNPSSYLEQAVPRRQKVWTGDCWKAWVQLRSERSDLTMQVVDADHGCGIIREGEQTLLTLPKDPDWAAFDYNRGNWLNLITVEEFNRLYAVEHRS